MAKTLDQLGARPSRSAPSTTKGQGSGLVWPLAVGTFKTTSGPGAMRRGTPSHAGQDFQTALGASVYATEDYQIVKVQPWDRSRPAADRAGSYVVVNGLKSGKQIVFMHLMDWNVRVGDIVKQGATFARAGNTGNASDNNYAILHMEVRERGTKAKRGAVLSPLQYLGGGQQLSPDQLAKKVSGPAPPKTNQQKAQDRIAIDQAWLASGGPQTDAAKVGAVLEAKIAQGVYESQAALTKATTDALRAIGYGMSQAQLYGQRLAAEMAIGIPTLIAEKQEEIAQQRRAMPLALGGFLAAADNKAFKLLGRKLGPEQRKTLQDLFISGQIDRGSLDDYFTDLPEYQAVQWKKQLPALQQDIKQLWVEVAGIEPTDANLGWASGQFQNDPNFSDMKLADFIKDSPQFKERFPGMPEGWDAAKYLGFEQQANSLFLEKMGRPVAPNEFQQLLAGKPVDIPLPKLAPLGG